jgi:catalase
MVPFQTPEKKMIGCEYVSEQEEGIISEMIEELKKQVDREYKGTQMLRQIHTKMHGCVKAIFTIDTNIPEELKVGVFKEARSFPAWIRFSNSNSSPQPDNKKDIRGCAIKLMDLKGEKIINDEKSEETQDFLLMSSETFFSNNLKQFSILMKAVAQGNKLKIALFFLTHFRVLFHFLKTKIICKHLFEINYWSTQPYQYGDQTKAVKYFLKPSGSNNLAFDLTNGDNYLRKNMAKTLAVNGVDYDFYIQLQTDAIKMPIEDPTIPWTSPFIKVAQIHIPPQTFDTPTKNSFGENLSFSVWHCLPEHRPLGSFNRARKRVYEELSKYRHKKNNMEMVEPIPAIPEVEETVNR